LGPPECQGRLQLMLGARSSKSPSKSWRHPRLARRT
jgi:hypothetical protein